MSVSLAGVADDVTSEVVFHVLIALFSNLFSLKDGDYHSVSRNCANI